MHKLTLRVIPPVSGGTKDNLPLLKRLNFNILHLKMESEGLCEMNGKYQLSDTR